MEQHKKSHWCCSSRAKAPTEVSWCLIAEADKQKMQQKHIPTQHIYTATGLCDSDDSQIELFYSIYDCNVEVIMYLLLQFSFFISFGRARHNDGASLLHSTLPFVPIIIIITGAVALLANSDHLLLRAPNASGLSVRRGGAGRREEVGFHSAWCYGDQVQTSACPSGIFFWILPFLLSF